MKKVGIIRCNAYSDDCPASGCFRAMRENTGKFKDYGEIQIIGLDTCGGCARGKPDKIIARAKRLIDRGAEVIHLSNCLIGACPSTDVYIQAIRDDSGAEVVLGTH
jgi:predicted metal-binding protein